MRNLDPAIVSRLGVESDPAISRDTGICPSVLFRARKKLGIPAYGGNPIAAAADESLAHVAEEIVRLYQEEYLSHKRIGERLGISAGPVRTFLMRRKLWQPGRIRSKTYADMNEASEVNKAIMKAYREEQKACEAVEWSATRTPVTQTKAEYNREAVKRHYHANAERKREYARQYYRANREKCKAKRAKWATENPERVKELRREWSKKPKAKAAFKRYRQKPEVKIVENMRRRLKEILKASSPRTKTLIGCSGEFLRAHIERQFTKRMSWDNYGTYWHIDHIMPCAAFDLSDPDQARQCFNWQNLRPLTAKQNMAKSDTITEPQMQMALCV